MKIKLKALYDKDDDSSFLCGFEVEPTTTLEEIRDIMSQLDLPRSMFLFWHNGEIMDVNRTLADYGIEADAVIHYALRPITPI